MTSIGSPSPFFLAGKKAYQIERSLRFNGADGPYLENTPSSHSNKRKMTFSFWFKRAVNTNFVSIFRAYGNASNRHSLDFVSGGSIRLWGNYNGSVAMTVQTTQLFRDFSAWYHFVLVLDTEQGTASNRAKMYVNGVQITDFSNSSYPSQNFDFGFNDQNVATQIGVPSDTQCNFYIAEFQEIDGLALDPSYFAETDAITGQWNPKKYTGSYGTNGFYLNFSDNSGTTATTLGKDSSGVGRNFTPNNFAVSDAVKDSPTNNFATLDVLAESGGTYSEGNLKVVGTSDPSSSTIGFASGKFYYEAYIDATSNIYVGVIPIDFGLNPARGGSWPHGAIAYRSSGQQYKLKAGGGYSSVSASYGASYTAGDIIGCAVDIDNDTVTFYKNGVSQGNTSDGVSYITASGTTSIYGALVYCNGGNNTFRLNFGQDSTFQGTVSAGGNTDANGIGDFKYTVPTGYKALCSANLPDPTIKLPNKHFDTDLYTGTGSSLERSAFNFQPDWLWFKSRSASGHNHALFDSVRGRAVGLSSDQTYSEFTSSASNDLVSFDNDGFTIGGNQNFASVNGSGTKVAWAWNAGDTDGKTYAVTVVSDSGNKYRFDGFGTSAVTLDLAEGGTYIFNYPSAHPFRFSTTSDGTHGGGSEYTTGVTVLSSTSVQIVVAASAPQLYYFCTIHSGMGGAINTNTTLGSSNFDGSIQTRVKVNLTAGFSIVTYTGNGTDGATIGHGLGVTPNHIIWKNLDTSANWINWQTGLNDTSVLLNLSAAAISASGNGLFTYADFNSTSLKLKTASNTNGNNQSMIAYCFSEVAGYSKFGSYTGNGSSDGTFVFTGFRPAVVIQKRTDTTGHWYIFDNKRNGFNVDNDSLSPNLSDAEYDVTIIDLLSNGFKLRTNAVAHNGSGGTYIYLAFAKSPFKNARAR